MTVYCKTCVCPCKRRFWTRNPRRVFYSKACKDRDSRLRRRKPIPVRACAYERCGQEFQPKKRSQFFCCENHRKYQWRIDAKKRHSFN